MGVCVFVHQAHACVSMCWGLGIPSGSWFSPPIIWALGLELRSLALVVCCHLLSHLASPSLAFNFPSRLDFPILYLFPSISSIQWMVRVVSSVLLTAKEIPQCWRKAGDVGRDTKRLWQLGGQSSSGPLAWLWYPSHCGSPRPLGASTIEHLFTWWTKVLCPAQVEMIWKAARTAVIFEDLSCLIVGSLNHRASPWRGIDRAPSIGICSGKSCLGELSKSSQHWQPPGVNRPADHHLFMPSKDSGSPGNNGRKNEPVMY